MEPITPYIDITKKLAKELGLVETISIANPLFGSKANSINGINPLWTQQFDYLIVIDFESTCWEGEQGGWKQPEIIEFPAVLLNVHSGQLEQEFQQYVCPTENQKLSEFCKSLTGITQQQVDDGVPLSTCLLLFSRWINTIKQNKNLIFHGNSTQKSENERLCTFVTWSDWDLATCLHNECRRKQISKLDILNQWVDLRATYKQLYNRRPQGLRGALSELGINFEGREHSGLCDARNTARLAWRMVQDGGVLKITTNINTTTSSRTSVREMKTCSKPKQEAEISGRKPLKTINSLTFSSGLHSKIQIMTNQLTEKHIESKNMNSDKSKFENQIYEKKNSSTVITTLENVEPLKSVKKCTSIFNTNFTNNITPKMVLIRSKIFPVGYKTPDVTKQSIPSSSFKKTPPLCNCGRRAMCKVANLPGPNQRCKYFACPNNKLLGMKYTSGCGFFRWET